MASNREPVSEVPVHPEARAAIGSGGGGGGEGSAANFLKQRLFGWNKSVAYIFLSYLS